MLGKLFAILALVNCSMLRFFPIKVKTYKSSQVKYHLSKRISVGFACDVAASKISLRDYNRMT